MKMVTLDEIKAKLIADSKNETDMGFKLYAFKAFVRACDYIAKNGLDYSIGMFKGEEMEGYNYIMIQIENRYCVHTFFKDFDNISRIGIMELNVRDLVEAITHYKTK